jgi:MFS transporter, FSR family, fosmidomycin resistance protein
MRSFNTPHLFQFLPLILLVAFAHFLVDTMLGIWPIYKSMAQLDIGKAGIIVAIGAFIGEGSQLLFGSLSDKGYRKRLIIIGLIIAMASSFLAYTSHYYILFTLYLVTCIGSGCFHPCAASLMSSLVPSRRSLLMAIFAAGGSLGLATSQLSYNAVYSFFDGHSFLLVLPALVLAIILSLLSFPSVPSKGPHSSKINFKDFGDFFKNRSLRALYFSQVANQSIMWGTIFILPDALRVLGYSDWICYGGGHFCFIMGAACMIIPGGYLCDLFSPRQVMLYGGMLSCAAFYFILFTGGISLTILLVSLFILGSTLALMNPIAVALGSKLEPNRTGTVSAFLMGLVWCVSEALGPGGVGALATFFDDYAPIKALAVLGSLFIVQTYALFLLPKEVSAVAMQTKSIST